MKSQFLIFAFALLALVAAPQDNGLFSQMTTLTDDTMDTVME